MKREHGYQGEQSLDYYYQFLNDDFLLMHDLRLRGINQTFFQIDTLILCPQFIGIIEVKNLAGSIRFENSASQMLRKLNDVVESLPNPLIQVRRQRLQLQHFFLNQNFPSIPIKTIVAFTNPTTIIETDHNPLPNSVIRAEALPEKLENFQTSSNKNSMTSDQLNKLAHCLCQAHLPDQPSVLQTYKLNYVDIRKGVDCPFCNRPFMTRTEKNGSWYCAHCFRFSKKAHLQALEEFSVIMDKSLTNKEARELLLIESRHTAYRMLNEWSGMLKNS